MIQQIGRVGRLKPGKAFLTTQQLEELVPSKDIVYHIINAIIAPAKELPMKHLNDKGYKFTGDKDDHDYQNLLWSSIAFTTKQNRPVEAVMIGMVGKPKGSKSSRKICPTFDNDPKPDLADK
ncbi:87_t:CDS:1, partial [Scutellospora calospora]